MKPRYLTLLLLVSCLLFLGADKPDKFAADKEALAKLQTYIGDWRGVGQPRRGSTKGAWREDSGWVWKFTAKRATLNFQTPKGKYFTSGVLRSLGKENQYELVAKAADGKSKVKYQGDLDQSGKLVLVANEPPAGTPARISIHQVARGDRMLVLFERQSTGKRFLRIAQVGYTRKGSNFGKGTSFVECVVTGGLGTIPVTHKGKTFFVCCGGCRDYFNEDPEGVLAEYRERKAAEKKEKNDS